MSEKTTWVERKVGDCLLSISFRSKNQIQAREYKLAGQFPVIDQGQSQIAGRTDDESSVISSPLPLVIFGDHTRALKFIDFPFARGGDGTQVLVPVSNLDCQFFFYACKHIDVPARGYNRHFTLLRESAFFCPENTVIQREIGQFLRLIDDAIDQEAAHLVLAIEIKQVTMNELFSNGLRGEAQKETEIGLIPKSWDVVQLGQTCALSTGTTPATKNKSYYDGDVPFIKTGDVVNNRIGIANTFLSHEAVADYGLKLFPPGTLLMAMYGQGKTRGQVSLLEIAATTTQNAAAIQPFNEMNSAFLWHYLMSSYERLRGMGSLGHVSHLNLGYLRDLLVIKPPLDEQREIAEILDGIDCKIKLHQQKKLILDELFNSLLHKLMTGEISVDDLDLSALAPEEPQPKTEAEVQP